jgi:hypothetical protein
MSSGYSGTPLAKKLGIKSNFKIKIVNPPSHYWDLFSDLPPGLKEAEEKNAAKDFIHCFGTNAGQLKKEIIQLKNELEPNGML